MSYFAIYDSLKHYAFRTGASLEHQTDAAGVITGFYTKILDEYSHARARYVLGRYPDTLIASDKVLLKRDVWDHKWLGIHIDYVNKVVLVEITDQKGKELLSHSTPFTSLPVIIQSVLSRPKVTEIVNTFRGLPDSVLLTHFVSSPGDQAVFVNVLKELKQLNKPTPPLTANSLASTFTIPADTNIDLGMFTSMMSSTPKKPVSKKSWVLSAAGLQRGEPNAV